jgi:hypothetical protein
MEGGTSETGAHPMGVRPLFIASQNKSALRDFFGAGAAGEAALTCRAGWPRARRVAPSGRRRQPRRQMQQGDCRQEMVRQGKHNGDFVS